MWLCYDLYFYIQQTAFKDFHALLGTVLLSLNQHRIYYYMNDKTNDFFAIPAYLKNYIICFKTFFVFFQEACRRFLNLKGSPHKQYRLTYSKPAQVIGALLDLYHLCVISCKFFAISECFTVQIISINAFMDSTTSLNS